MSSEKWDVVNNRYYVCELKFNDWTCNEKGFYDQFDYKETKENTGVKLITIRKIYPQILDPLLLKYKLASSVKIQ
jgi:hypothetical protein